MDNRTHAVYRFFAIMALVSCFCFDIASASAIHLTLRPAPPKVKKAISAELATQKLEKLANKSPDRMEHKLRKNGFKHLFPKVSGFIGLYGGYVDYSDNDGTISFPLLHKEQKIYIVITPQIAVETIYQNTISHLKFLPDMPTEIYKLEKLSEQTEQTASEQTASDAAEKPQGEGEGKTYYWNVSLVPKKEHDKISSIALILLTKPKNLVVPTGDFMTTEATNFVLPSVYVVGNVQNPQRTMEFLDIRKYFEQIELKQKVDDTGEQSLIKNR